MAAKKNPQLAVGQMFLVPLLDGSHTLGQLCFVHYHTKSLVSVASAFFAHRSTDTVHLNKIAADPSNLHTPLFVMMPTADMLNYGVWSIIDQLPLQPVEYTNFDLRRHVSTTGVDNVSMTGYMALEVLEMYWGIVPWDWYRDPHYLDKNLLPGFQVPPYPVQARFKKAFTEDELVLLEDRRRTRLRVDAKKWPRRRSGKNTVHIQYPYDGAGLPNVEQLRRRHALEALLGEKNAGEIEEAGGGEGVMDVFVSTRDPDKSRAIVEKVLAEMGIPSATVTIE